MIEELEGYTRTTSESEPCRWCGDPAFGYTDKGWTHVCCEAYQTKDCIACKESRIAEREWQRRQQEKARREALENV